MIKGNTRKSRTGTFLKGTLRRTWAHGTCREFVTKRRGETTTIGIEERTHYATCSCGAALTWRSLRGARLTGPLQASRASTWSSRHALPGCRDGNVSTRSHPPPTPPLCAHIGFEESAILCPLRCRSHRTSSTSWCIDTCMSQVRIAHHWCKFCEMASAQTASHERRGTRMITLRRRALCTAAPRRSRARCACRFPARRLHFRR